MASLLLTYATLSGSTVEVAEAIGEELAGQGFEVNVLPLDRAKDPGAYDALVIGAPMILGWHRSAGAYLRRHRQALAQTPVALFATAMSLTWTGETAVSGVSVYVDPNLGKPPRRPDHPSLRERYARLPHYASPMLRALGNNRPVSMAFFGGKLDYFRLKPLPRLFVMLAVQAQPGDRRNWPVIRAWAAGLPALLEAQTDQS